MNTGMTTKVELQAKYLLQTLLDWMKMSNSVYITGKSRYERTRRTKEFNNNRLCTTENCKTTLSRYNPADKCFLHAPAKQGRVRGWKQPD